jgi:hypothetical protein
MADPIESATEVNAVPTEYTLRPAQKEMLDTIFNRLRGYEEKVLPKLRELQQAFQEAVFFVKKDLGVPANEQWAFNEHGTSFVKIELPTVVAAEEASDEASTVVAE